MAVETAVRRIAVPWHKQFDIDDVLAKAMRGFWAHGYEATSMEDLVSCMGINRGSLYATFGGKRRLFITALRRYDACHRGAWTARLSESGSPKRAIIRAFEEAAGAVLERGSTDGCLLVNTALELSPHDPEISAIVARALTEMETFFRREIENGQACGEIPGAIDAAATASGLLSLFLGLRVLARSRPEARLLHNVVDQARALITCDVSTGEG